MGAQPALQLDGATMHSAASSNTYATVKQHSVTQGAE